MKRLMTAACCACLFGALASAQTAFPEKTEKGKTAAGGKTMIVTGCVAAGTDSGHFMLTNGMTPGDTAGKSYALMGSDLQAHVGHEVEITGAVSDGNAMGKNTMSTKDKMSKDKMSKDNMGDGKATVSMLQVKSVKMIAPNCS